MLEIKEETQFSLINDSAIEKIKYDTLDFDIYAEVLSESILETPSPFTIGIYGEWGKGKTSLLNFLVNSVQSVKGGKRVINAFYDIWKYEENDNPLIDILEIIEQSIQEQQVHLEEDVVIELFDFIKYIKYAILSLTSKTQSQTQNPEHSNIDKYLLEIYDLLKKLEKLLIEKDILFIVYIDNLDKCSSKNSLKVLESINLVFNLKGFSFVLAADEKQLEEQLKTNIKNSNDYLNKTVNLPFYLPSFSGKINELLDNIHLKSVSGKPLDENIKNVIYSISFLPNLTPRLVTKLINRIKISSKIYIRLNPNTQLEEKKIFSLFSISCVMEELFKEFHNLLVKSDSIARQVISFIQNETFHKDEILKNINILPKEKELVFSVLEKNFKVLKNIFSTEQGKYWLENKFYRISAFEFLKSNNEIVENVQIDSLPVYKTDFSDNIVPLYDGDIDPKEFIKIPNENIEFSKYVITNKWYEEFILAGGYDNPKYWNNIESKVWLIDNKIHSLDEKYSSMLEKESVYFKKKFGKVLKKEDFNSELQPIVYITYYEAIAFCKYLSEIDSQYEYFIPSKNQWEYVANAGDKKRVYPWGNTWNKNYCNNGMNQLNKTTEIGMFPQGNSKFGVSDMVGNVWVWTSTLDNNDYNYLKGGSWNFNDPSYFKISNSQMTFYNNPSYQHYDIGFLCARRKRKN